MHPGPERPRLAMMIENEFVSFLNWLSLPFDSRQRLSLEGSIPSLKILPYFASACGQNHRTYTILQFPTFPVFSPPRFHSRFHLSSWLPRLVVKRQLPLSPLDFLCPLIVLRCHSTCPGPLTSDVRRFLFAVGAMETVSIIMHPNAFFLRIQVGSIFSRIGFSLLPFSAS